MTRRWFFVPSGDGHAWDLVEATKAESGWTVRRPGRFGAQQLPKIPPEGADWVEAAAPSRKPKVAVRTKEPVPPAKARAVEDALAPAPAKPPAAQPPPRPARKPKARHTKPVPKLSQELIDLMAKEQREAPAPAGMVKCPLCGLALEPMKVRKVRTHDDPVKGERCAASGQKLPAPSNGATD